MSILEALLFGCLLGFIFPSIMKVTFLNVNLFYIEHSIPFIIVFYLKLVYFEKHSLNLKEH